MYSPRFLSTRSLSATGRLVEIPALGAESRYRESMDDESMSLAATFAFEHEAHLAQALLESAGIPAFLRNENVNRLNVAYAMSEAGWELYVPASAEQEARDLLNSRVSPAQLASEAE